MHAAAQMDHPTWSPASRRRILPARAGRPLAPRHRRGAAVRVGGRRGRDRHQPRPRPPGHALRRGRAAPRGQLTPDTKGPGCVPGPLACCGLLVQVARDVRQATLRRCPGRPPGCRGGRRATPADVGERRRPQAEAPRRPVAAGGREDRGAPERRFEEGPGAAFRELDGLRRRPAVSRGGSSSRQRGRPAPPTGPSPRRATPAGRGRRRPWGASGA